jgi:heme/copper-type cytochrome/quinol oxidase subunit 3
MEHVEAHGHGDDHAEAFERARFGMWLFLASEIMMFGAFIAVYTVLRMGPGEGAVKFFKDQLSIPIATFNTAVLILSSYTMVRGVHAISQGKRGHCEDMLIATAALGTLFLVVKGIEYAQKFEHGLGPSSSVMFGCYFLLTGFHGIHVLVGVILLVWCAFYVKKFDEHHYAHVENLAMYWHFVDLVWIFLFPIVYLL